MTKLCQSGNPHFSHMQSLEQLRQTDMKNVEGQSHYSKAP